jgi:predicted ArsR family transcriptional regulator
METPEWVVTWQENTSAFDRVRSVAMSGSDPQTASEVAERARVAESTARDHLERLVEIGTLRTRSTDGRTVYRHDPVYIRFRAVRDLIEDHTESDLTEFVAELKEAQEATEREYGNGSSEELRQRAAAAETSAAEARELLRAAENLDHYEYRRSLLADALERYDDYRTPEPATG